LHINLPGIFLFEWQSLSPSLLPLKLPVVIELIDTEEKIREFYDTIAPELQALPKGCLVTVSPVEVILHKSGTKRDKLI
jgi:PII-like signaling protein